MNSTRGAPMYRPMVGLFMLAVVTVNDAGASELDRTGLLNRVVGNTLHFASAGEQVFEFLDPSGEIRGESSAHGKYSAHWRLLDDRTMCFESADPMASGCVGVELKGRSLTFIRRDGVIEGPFELLPGNPRSL
jgi:hypothetical protein